MQTLDDLACAIDSASDTADEALLRKLIDDCEYQLLTAKGEDRLLLQYYQSNAYAAIVSFKYNDRDYTWSWEQPEGIRNILLLRQAINEPAFGAINVSRAFQIRTNLANRLSNFGRYIAANEQYLAVLETFPTFAKALANRASVLSHYARALYDEGHAIILVKKARALYEAALSDDAFWESGDRADISLDLIEEVKQIEFVLNNFDLDDDFDPSTFTLGSTSEERSYRLWCLEERLFLNPLNDVFAVPVAATDVLHLPSHTYRTDGAPRFVEYYNVMKQEYISARYRLYRAIHEADPEFLMRDVLMIDCERGQCIGHYTEEIRSAFRSCYSIFDKIALFMNDYYCLGLNPRRVTFRRVWLDNPNDFSSGVHSKFENYQNLPLRGLYFLSKDVFDTDMKDIAEPNAEDLALLRHQLEHRFLSIQHPATDASTEVHRFVPIESFLSESLRLLKMVREALIYLSLAMHREERLRDEQLKREDES